MNYIPTKDVDVVAWADNFSAVLTAAPADYNSSAPVAVIIAGLVATFDADFATDGTVGRRAVNPAARTKAGVAALRTAKAAMLAVIRPLAVTISLDATISDELKTAIGVTVRDSIKTHIPAPTSYPNLVVTATGPLIQEVRFSDALTPTLKAKPAGVIGMQLFGVVSGTVITDPASIPFIAFVTKQPLELAQAAEDRAKIMYFVGRWQNRKGEHGPFGPIISAVIS